MRLICLLIFIFSFSLVNGQISYEIDHKREGLIFGGSAIMFGGSFWIDNARKPISIEEIMSSVPSVNSFDRQALNNSSLQAKNASDVLFYFTSAVPMGLLASSQLRGKEVGYLMMYGETVALNGGITFLVKSISDRKRPYFYNSSFPIEERQDKDARKAFFSGHTSHTAALSFFTARVFADIYPESKWKRAIWTGAAIIPAATAYFRVQAGRHFPSDVMVGYAVGASVGLLIPYLHRKMKNPENVWNISPTINGIALVYKI